MLINVRLNFYLNYNKGQYSAFYSPLLLLGEGLGVRAVFGPASTFSV